jgi:hypothetical protein
MTRFLVVPTLIARVEQADHRHLRDRRIGWREGALHRRRYSFPFHRRLQIRWQGRQGTHGFAFLRRAYEGAVVNGPSFVYFPVGPLDYQKKFVKDGKDYVNITVHQGEPLLLAYLKRRADGRYEPVSGQEDADDSFYEVHSPCFPRP